MTSQPVKQTIAIHILPNISSSKGNQEIKFGQLIKYNIRNILLEESYTILLLFRKNDYQKIQRNCFLFFFFIFFFIFGKKLVIPMAFKITERTAEVSLH